MDTAAGGDLTDVTAALRRRWPIAAAGAAAGLLLAVVALLVAPQTYTSTTAVHVRPTGIPEITGEQSGRTNGEVNLDTEAQIVQSSEVAQAAAERIGGGADPVELQRDVAVSVPPNSSVLRISFPGADPQEARRGSAAFAGAYLDYRSAQVERQIGDTLAALEEEAKARRADLEELGSAAGGGSGNRQGRITALQNEITELNKEIHPLRALRASIVPAQIITPATTPEEATSPVPALWLAAGGVLGLALGLGAAFAVDRGDHRLHTTRDIERAADGPVLLQLPRTADPAGCGEDPAPRDRKTDQRANRAALGLAAALARTNGEPPQQRASGERPGEKRSGSGAVVLVPAVSPGAFAVPAAAALAAALARIGNDVLLVGADPADASTANGAGRPGLADVLLGGADPAELERRTAAAPGLRILDYGGADAADVLQRPAMARLVHRLRASADFVVVATAPTTERADACALADTADAVVPVVDLGTTRVGALREALTAFAALGALVPGTIAVPAAEERSRTTRRTAAASATRGPGQVPAELVAESSTARAADAAGERVEAAQAADTAQAAADPDSAESTDASAAPAKRPTKRTPEKSARRPQRPAATSDRSRDDAADEPAAAAAAEPEEAAAADDAAGTAAQAPGSEGAAAPATTAKRRTKQSKEAKKPAAKREQTAAATGEPADAAADTDHTAAADEADTAEGSGAESAAQDGTDLTLQR